MTGVNKALPKPTDSLHHPPLQRNHAPHLRPVRRARARLQGQIPRTGIHTHPTCASPHHNAHSCFNPSYSLSTSPSAPIFFSLEGWAYLDGIYWTNYSLLTIGFEPSVNSRRHIHPRSRHYEDTRRLHPPLQGPRRVGEGNRPNPAQEMVARANGLREELSLVFLVLEALAPDWEFQTIPTLRAPTKWSRQEWEVMRYVKKRADDRRRYFSVFIVIWFGGAALFWVAKRVSMCGAFKGSV